MNGIRIIAGPCSIDEYNKNEVLKSLTISYKGRSALYGVRVVGIKSRTAFDPVNAFVGVDIHTYEQNIEIIASGGKEIKIHPSVEIANEIQAQFPKIWIATEVIDPWVQCMNLEKYLISDRAIVWNPAVNHLGFPLRIMSKFSQKRNWQVGIKNGKALGGSAQTSEIRNLECNLDKSWVGLSTYTNNIESDRVFLIHRGIDCEDNAGYRNLPVHQLCKRVKKNSQNRMFLDPSHILGPKKRDEIINFTIDAMQLKMEDGSYLYDGILIESGTAKSDTGQHVTLDELENMVSELTKFRTLDND